MDAMRILIPFCDGVPPDCFYQEFYLGISEALRELGHDPVPFRFASMGSRPQPAEVHALYRLLQTARPRAVLDLACWGYAFSRITVPVEGGAMEPIFDAHGIPCVGLLFDQPYNQAINGIVAARLYATYPDLGHAEQVRLISPQLKPAGEIFAPPAVRPDSHRSARDWASGRDIDVLYVGNLQPAALDYYWNDRFNPLWDTAYHPAFCNVFADAALSEPERPLQLGFRAAISEFGTRLPQLDLGSQFRAVEGFLRFRFRRDAVMAIARSGVRLRVVGKGWREAGLPENVETGDETNYQGFIRLAARAKICLDASTYLEGANDRVFTYAINRAVCFTNAAGYLRREFGENEGMRFYSMRSLSSLGEQLKGLLARPGDLREAGEHAKQVTLSRHIWRCRAEAILRMLRGG